MTLAATPVCADTDVMTDTSVSQPTLTAKSGATPTKLDPAKEIKYPKTADPVTFVVKLTSNKDEPVKITSFELPNAKNIDKVGIKVFKNGKELVDVIRSPDGPLGPNVSMFFNKLSMIKVFA